MERHIPTEKKCYSFPWEFLFGYYLKKEKKNLDRQNDGRENVAVLMTSSLTITGSAAKKTSRSEKRKKERKEKERLNIRRKRRKAAAYKKN